MQLCTWGFLCFFCYAFWSNALEATLNVPNSSVRAWVERLRTLFDLCISFWFVRMFHLPDAKSIQSLNTLHRFEHSWNVQSQSFVYQLNQCTQLGLKRAQWRYLIVSTTFCTCTFALSKTPALSIRNAICRVSSFHLWNSSLSKVSSCGLKVFIALRCPDSRDSHLSSVEYDRYFIPLFWSCVYMTQSLRWFA